MCASAYARITGVNIATLKNWYARFCGRALAAPQQRFSTGGAKERSICVFVSHLARTIGEVDPTAPGIVTLPLARKVEYLEQYNKCVSSELQASASYFYRILDEKLPNVHVPRVGHGITKCNTCLVIKRLRDKAKDGPSRLKAMRDLQRHRDQARLARDQLDEYSRRADIPTAGRRGGIEIQTLLSHGLTELDRNQKTSRAQPQIKTFARGS